MKVRELLSVMNPSADVRVFQVPIKQSGGTNDPDDLIIRQRGSCSILAQSNQNYLDFDVQNVKANSGGIIFIICKANTEQERDILTAYYEGR